MVRSVASANGLFGMTIKRGNHFFKKLLICSLFPFHVFSEISPAVVEKIEKIPIEDQKIIQDFFRNMLSLGDFSAVLLGDKPSSNHCWVWWIVKTKKRKIKDFLFLTYKEWITWKKYQYLFSGGKYSFLEEGYNNGCFSIWFINKELIDESSLKFFFFENKALKASVHKKMGEFLGYPEEDIAVFCEEVQLESLAQYLPYDTDYKSFLENHLELDMDYIGDPVSRLETLKKDLNLVPFFVQESNFFPTRNYGRRSLSKEIPENIEWKQKVVELYNSNDFLGEVLTLFIE